MSAKSPTAIFSPGTPMTPGASYVIDRDVDLSALHEHLDVPPTTTLTIASGVGLSAQTVTIGNNARLQLDGGHLECDSMSVGKSASIEGRGSISSREGSSAIFTTAPGALLDFTDIEVSLGSSGSLTAGAGTTLRLANRKLTTSVLSSPSGRSNIDAPERHVMNLNSFEGQWHSPQAFAQWFIEPTGEDWADAINNALTIDAEAVYLPGQLIRISKTIKMPCKSRLIGRTRGLTVLKKYSGAEDTSYYGTLIAPTADAQLTQGLMILLNISETFFDDLKIPANYYTYIHDTKDAWAEGTPPAGAEVADIRFFARKVVGSGPVQYLDAIKAQRGVFVAGAAKFTNLVFCGFEQAISWSKDYADCKHLERCTSQEVSGKLTSDNTPYAFDLMFLGDAAIVDGCHILPENVKGLRLNLCGGARITNNILNADIEIRGCKGILYSGNHSENGAQLSIIDSSVEVSANYFEKGQRPSVVVGSGSVSNSSVVTLSNNVYAFMTQRNRESAYRPSAGYGKYINIEDVCEYDVAVAKCQVENSTPAQYTEYSLAAVNINNEMRYYIPPSQYGRSVTTGINICRFSPNNVGIYEPVKEFNKCSQFLSRDAKLAVLWKDANRVQFPSFKYRNISAPVLNSGFETYGAWTYPEGMMPENQTLDYYFQIIYDEDRKIAGALTHLELFAVPHYAKDDKDNPIVGVCDKVIGFSLVSADVAAGKQIKARLFRVWTIKDTSGNVKSTKYQYVDVPMCVASVIIDIGVSVNGFRWITHKILTGVNSDQYLQSLDIGVIENANVGIRDIEFHNDNVTVWSSSKITNTSGWKSGDIIYNIGSDTSWTQQIIK